MTSKSSSSITDMVMMLGSPQVISAGFIRFQEKYEETASGEMVRTGEMKASCSGESVGLGVSARPIEDAKLAYLQLLGEF